MTQGTLSIGLQPGNQMGSGTYTGTISVTACLDATCANPVQGSPFQIAVTYNVGSSITVGGANGYTVQGLQLQSLGMVWDPLNQVIWVVQHFDSTGVSHVAAVSPLGNARVSRVRRIK